MTSPFGSVGSKQSPSEVTVGFARVFKVRMRKGNAMRSGVIKRWACWRCARWRGGRAQRAVYESATLGPAGPNPRMVYRRRPSLSWVPLSRLNAGYKHDPARIRRQTKDKIEPLRETYSGRPRPASVLPTAASQLHSQRMTQSPGQS